MLMHPTRYYSILYYAMIQIHAHASHKVLRVRRWRGFATRTEGSAPRAWTRNGATEFVREGGGILYFDAGYWKLFPQKGTQAGASGWNFSQKGSQDAPPLGRWVKANAEKGEQTQDYSSLVLEGVGAAAGASSCEHVWACV